MRPMNCIVCWGALSRELTVDEKLDIIGNEYDIPLEENFKKGHEHYV